MYRLRAWLGGQDVKPVAVLAGLNLVDEFDRIAYATLTPEIRDAFGSTDATINTIGVLSAVSVLLIAAPSGRLADRFSRVRLSLGAAMLWGVCSVLTGIVPTLTLLLLVRFLSGVGRNANEVIHPSLVSDLYEPDTHPRAFFIHRLANPTAQASGLLAGLIAESFGWRWSFVLLALPTIVLAIALLQVDEPPRRALDSDHSNLSVREAFAELRGLKSLPRLWGAAFFLGASTLGIYQLITVFFEQEYGFGPTGRGFAQLLVGLGWVAGIVVGAQIADRLPVEQTGRLATLCARGFGLFSAVGSLVIGFAPGVTVALGATVVTASGNGIWQAPYFSAVGRIAPAGLSGQAYASTTTFYALGALLSIPVFLIGDKVNYRVAFCIVAALATTAALIGRTAAEPMQADVDR